jgi:predicted phosphate transport protein (TIGR00153 family)
VEEVGAVRIDRWIRKLLPRDEKFLSLFIQDIENLTEASRALIELLNAPTEQERLRLVKVIEELEHRGDEFTHLIFRELGLTFITPLDREDIAGLASSLDDIMDNIDRAATCIQLYQIHEFDEPIRDLAGIIERSNGELRRAIPLLRDLRDSEPIREACVRVNAYENQADVIFHRALAKLFQEETDPIALIKKRELLAMLESATDRCEDAAVMIENVLVKYA